MSGRLDLSDTFGQAFPLAKFEVSSIEHDGVEEVPVLLPVFGVVYLFPTRQPPLPTQDIPVAMSSSFFLPCTAVLILEVKGDAKYCSRRCVVACKLLLLLPGTHSVTSSTLCGDSPRLFFPCQLIIDTRSRFGSMVFHNCTPT